jgi:hypothetical protein
MFNFKETLRVSVISAWLVLKLIIPLYILADLLLYYDVLKYIAFMFEPITDVLDLPKEAALGIAAGMLFNLYAGIAFLAPLDLSAYQWTILATFLGVAHSLIVESAVMKKIGISYIYSFVLRISMAFIAVIPILYMPKELFNGTVFGNEGVLKVSYTDLFDLLQNSFYNASILSLKVITLITAIIFLMSYLKSTKMMQRYQKKVNSSFSIMAGLILGITYGAGILIHESKTGNLNKVDLFYIATFLMICHSVVEDVLLFVIFGANGWIVVTIRLMMAFVFSYILVRMYKPRL